MPAKPALSPACCDFSSESRSTREARHAGMSADATTENATTPAANARMRQSGVTARIWGLENWRRPRTGGNRRSSGGIAAQAKAAPSAAPATAKIRLSKSISRMMCRRPAPTASRDSDFLAALARSRQQQPGDIGADGQQ
jgi:hypothetical protein